MLHDLLFCAGLFDVLGWKTLHAVDDFIGEVPGLGYGHPQFFVGDAEDGPGSTVLVDIVFDHPLLDFLVLLREVADDEHLPQVEEHGADERLFLAVHFHLFRQVHRQDAAHIGRHSGLLQLRQFRLVLEVFEDHEGRGDHPHLFETEQKDRLGNRRHPAGKVAVKGGIDDSQELIGQREILQDDIGQFPRG